jgi:pyrroline-5-carboxylate reductase
VANKYGKIVEGLLRTFGAGFRVGSEKLIDASTAITGSGPAYWYATAEAQIEAACKLGFREKDAELLVRETFLVSAELAARTFGEFESLRKKVTSKGGTTEAALNQLKRDKFIKVWQRATRAAYLRARELSK